MHQIDTSLRQNCLFNQSFQRVKLTDSDFDEAKQFGNDCLQIEFDLKNKQIDTLKS